MNLHEASEKWGLLPSVVQYYCETGRIEGAEHFEDVWLIPKEACKPRECCDKSSKNTSDCFSCKSPFLDMTNLYDEPGNLYKALNFLSSYPKLETLFKAEIAYSKGEIDDVIISLEQTLMDSSDFYQILGGNMLLALSAMWKGDVALWKKSRRNLIEIKCKESDQRGQVLLSLACIDTAIRDLSVYPEWFKQGKFEYLPADSFPCAKVFYVKYLLIHAQELAMRRDSSLGRDMLKVLPYLIEPMIAQAIIDKTIIPEIYLRVLCAIVYHQTGRDDNAIEHLDKAIHMALPDNLLGILVEHRRQLDFLLDERLSLIDKAAYKRFQQLHEQLLNGWTKVHNTMLGRKVSTSLTIREREVARLAAFGYRNKEIANQLNISIATTKRILYDVMNKTGTNSRTELCQFI